MKSIIVGNIRIQLLSENLLRIEKGKQFEDRNTFFVPNRSALENEIECSVKEKKDRTEIRFSGYVLTLGKGKGLHGITLYRKKECIYRFTSAKNTGELPPFDKTPEVYVLADSPRIILPEEGYHAVDGKPLDYEIEKNAKDYYLLLAEKDPRKLRRLYLAITGRAPLLRLSAYGSWNSKYYAYTQKEAEDIIRDYQKHDIPLDNVVIDTDWREMSSGIGYDINTTLFPDMKAYFDFAHSQDIEIMFNDHPEPQPGCENLLSPKEVSFREEKLQSLMKMGLDYWWYDRNWTTKLISPDGVIHPETWGMYLFSDIEKHYYQSKVKTGEPYRRLGVMSNVDNIANGIYFGIQNSASHRYPFQWTGDIDSEERNLYEAIEDVLRGGENCIPYVHPDCGGHTGNPDKELFIRWMQIGCFLPVFRPHCTNTVIRTREPWQYDEETTDIVREAVKRRYRLLPTIYQMAYQSYLEGTPLCKRIIDEYPTEKKAVDYFGEYLFSSLLVAYPDYEKVRKMENHPISSDDYITQIQATYYNGTKLEGEPILRKEYGTIDFNVSGKPFEPGLPIYDFSARFEGDINLKTERSLALRVDDGMRIFVDGKSYLEDWSMHSAKTYFGPLLSQGKHHLVIEYFQAGGEAVLQLRYAKENGLKNSSVYLPGGEWLDLFHGKNYSGKQVIEDECTLSEMPLFVKRGSVLVLASDSNRTKTQDWNTLTFDYYPSKTGTFSSAFYQDDFTTTAYEKGVYALMRYDVSYRKESSSFLFTFHKQEGRYECQEKTFRIKYHSLYEKGISKILLNGKEIDFHVVPRNMKAPVLGVQESSLDSDTVLVTFRHDMKKEDILELILDER